MPAAPMIKKYFNQSLLSKTRHQSSAQMQMRLPLTTTSKVVTSQALTLSFVSAKLRPNKVSLNRQATTNTAKKLAALVMLQGMILLPVHAASANKTGQRVLMIEMTPALCSIQPTRARMRQCLEGYSLTVSGLDMGYGERCGVGSEPRLTPLQLKVVNRVMPDTTVRSQAWQRYGVCSPLSAGSYFRQITNYSGALKLPNELNTGNSYTVSKSRFIGQMTRLNSGMSTSSVDLICQDANRRQSILTDVHICYEGNQFGRCSTPIDNCGKNFIISGGK